MKYLRLIFSIFVVVGVIAITSGGSALAASTTKSLSTNFTLVNLGDSVATVSVDYLKSDGSVWTANADYTSFTVPADGGQKILRQYDAASGMSSGQGSVVVSSDQPLGAVVQIQARSPQVSTLGAYNGASLGSNLVYLPLLFRQLSSGSGLVNSQVIVQNTDTVARDVTITLTKDDGSTFVKNVPGLAAGVSYYYDLADEAGISTNWLGSAVVTASGGGKVTAVGNIFVGAHGLMSYGGFADETKTSEWSIPLLTSRLSNGQSTSVSIQNLSGGTLGVGDIELKCTKDPSFAGPDTITVLSTTAVSNKGAYNFNTVVDTTNFPADWLGACTVRSISGGNIVAFAQVRYTNGKSDAAAYEGIPTSSTKTTLYVPLVMKRLANGAATSVTIANLDKVNGATVTLNYIPSPDYVAAGGSATPVVIPGVAIAAGGSVVRNHRLVSGAQAETALPNGWYGTLKVTSNRPIQSYIAITNINPLAGDWLMAHIGFTK